MKQIIKGDEITVEIDLANGARLSSVKWGGYEFSVQQRENVLHEWDNRDNKIWSHVPAACMLVRTAADRSAAFHLGMAKSANSSDPFWLS